MKAPTVRRSVAALTAALLAAVALPAHGAPTVALPTADPFYSYTGTTPLGQIPPGTVLKTRTISMHISGTDVAVPGDQLLYRTAGELAQPTVTVTTVLKPPTAPALGKIVSYQSFYDALGAQCDPSYWLNGGDSGPGTAQNVDAEEGLISQFLAAGYYVNVSDFEGEDLHWSAGHESGYGTLDSLRAAEADLELPASTPIGLYGYSGGSIASEWASEIAPLYAPDLNIVGVAEGGIPVDYAHNLTYISGSASWSGIMPGILLALTRAYGVDIDQYLSPYGIKLVDEARGQCINSLLGKYPGLTVKQLLKPEYSDPFQIPDFVRIINNLTMGTAPGHPDGPLLMAVGDADGTGDGVMIAADVQALAHEYCQEGVHVQLMVEQGLAHTQAAVPWAAAALPFLEERLNGAPFVDGCADIPAGSSLALLPMPKPVVKAAGTVVTVRITNGQGGHHGSVEVPSSGRVDVRVQLRLAKGAHSTARLSGRRIKVGKITVITGRNGVATGHFRITPGPLIGIRAQFAGNARLARSTSRQITVYAPCPSSERGCAA
ncbi:MAG TPA: lipase family protein [Mycobacteriales bacterium]|nr:lipase family protein [Mycobacteriales bacterium]